MSRCHATRPIHRLPRLRENRGNCFLYGCVTLVILALLGGLVAFLTFRYAIQQLREKYTESEPVELPTVDMPQDRIDSLIDRVDQYVEDLRAGKELAPITLTESEINALLQNHADLKEAFGDHMYLTLTDDGTVKAEMSLPLDWFPMMGGRFFNGNATFDVGLDNGRFTVFLESASVEGEEVPQQQLQQIRNTNLAEDWYDDPEARELIESIQSIEFKDNAVTVTPVNRAGESSDDGEDTEAEGTSDAA